MKRWIGMLVIVAALGAGATRVYDVELSQNDNAMAGPPDGVGQTWVATCDSVQWCEVFIGRPIASGFYVFRIFDSTGTRLVSSEIQVAASDKQYQYVRATFAQACTVTKGVKYRLKVRHSDTNSVNYYYNRDSSSYHYGELWANGQKTAYDLAARIEGVIS